MILYYRTPSLPSVVSVLFILLLEALDEGGDFHLQYDMHPLHDQEYEKVLLGHIVY